MQSKSVKIDLTGDEALLQEPATSTSCTVVSPVMRGSCVSPWASLGDIVAQFCTRNWVATVVASTLLLTVTMAWYSPGRASLAMVKV